MTYALNLTDLIFTIHALRHGAEELNPFIRYAMTIPFCISLLQDRSYRGAVLVVGIHGENQ